ncbi:MAG: tetratricopeptide repeat protein, partial [bacterium]|nr:tetratricopeptide repeat protein [bacterium]
MKYLPGYGAVILIGVMFAAGQVPAENLGPQEVARVMALYEEAMALLEEDQLDLALQRFQEALEIDKEHVLSSVGMGHVYLQKSDLDAAENAFRAALKKDKKYAPALNGMGLVYRERPKELRRAIRYFRDAVRADKASAEAQYNLAQTYQRFGSSETLKAYREVLKIDPRHPDALFQIGRIYELDGKLEDAEQALRKQVAVDANHYEAWLHLGIVLKRMNQIAEAVEVLERVVGQSNPFQRRSVLELADVFQQGREYDRSQALFERYIHSLEPSEQMLYYDLSLVASGDMVDKLKGAPLEQVKEVAEKFWASLDPAPVTAANERLIEHFRRVAVASEHMGMYKKPWDDRGEVYIRYGEPDHVSRSGDIRFE